MHNGDTDFGQLDTNPAWTRVDVVFDAIFKYLTVAQLKQIRLVNKSFSVTAAKFLTRKSLIRLTGIVNLEQAAAEKVPVLTCERSPDSPFFECPCELEASPKEYISIVSYTEYLQSAAFNSNFIPKCISVVSSSDIWLLPLPHFSLLEDLHVLTFTPSEALRILDELPSLFPNLKSLEFQYIQPDLEANGEPQHQEVSESTSIAKKRKKSQDLLLEKLAITVSSHWPYDDLNLFNKLPNLKTLSLRWSGEYPTNCHDRRDWIEPNGQRNVYYARFDLKSDIFWQWLLAAALAPNFRFLTELNLRLDLTPTNTKSTQKVLNSLNLQRLSLELHGIVEELSTFILGLNRSTISALRKILWTCLNLNAWRTSRQALTWLGENGFFEKSEWTLTFHELCDDCGDDLWFYLDRTKNQLVQHNRFFPNIAQVLPIVSKYLKVNFNYTFRRVLYNDGYSYNDFELFEPQDLFQSRDAVGSRYSKCKNAYPMETVPVSKRKYKACSCHRCSPRQTILLCDMFTLFPEEIGIIWPPHEHHLGSATDLAFTQIFCYVHPEIFSKWMKILNPPYFPHSETG